MKLVIFKDGISREINGDFSMCIGQRELKHLADAFQNEWARREQGNVSYGWFVVRQPAELPKSVTPKPWNE